MPMHKENYLTHGWVNFGRPQRVSFLLPFTDRINAVMSAVGMNFFKLLRYLKATSFLRLFRPWAYFSYTCFRLSKHHLLGS